MRVIKKMLVAVVMAWWELREEAKRQWKARHPEPPPQKVSLEMFYVLKDKGEVTRPLAEQERKVREEAKRQWKARHPEPPRTELSEKELIREEELLRARRDRLRHEVREEMLRAGELPQHDARLLDPSRLTDAR